MPLLGKLLIPFSESAKNLQFDEAQQQQALHTAKSVASQLSQKYHIDPFLYGSMATGLNVPGKYDYDYGVHITDPAKYEALVNQFSHDKDFTPSRFNEPGKDLHTFKTEVQGVPIDLNLMFGDNARIRREAVERVSQQMQADPSRRQQLVKQKAAVKDLLPKIPVVGNPLAYQFKAMLDREIGIPRLKREDVPEEQSKDAAELTPEQLGHLSRSDVFGHRTVDLTPIIQSGKLLSAAQAARLGSLKSVEESGANRGNRVELGDLKGPQEFRSQVFMTKGILPAGGDYGNYGVLFRKRNADPSKYINTIPQEYLHEGDWRSKLTFVVPDHEYSHWQSKYPDQPIIRESQIPQDKILPERAGLMEIAGRLLSGPEFTQKKELVKLNSELAEDGVHKLQGHINFQGLPIDVENRKGSVRKGVGKDGKPWRTVMKAPYGYIKGSKGKDGEGVDVYVGPDKKAPTAFVVHQHKENGKGYDEDKVILGVTSKDEAEKLYLQHYDDPKFLGPISEVDVADLRKRVESKERLEKISAAYSWWVKCAAFTGHTPLPPAFNQVKKLVLPKATALPSVKTLAGNVMNSHALAPTIQPAAGTALAHTIPAPAKLPDFGALLKGADVAGSSSLSTSDPMLVSGSDNLPLEDTTDSEKSIPVGLLMSHVNRQNKA